MMVFMADMPVEDITAKIVGLYATIAANHKNNQTYDRFTWQDVEIDDNGELTIAVEDSLLSLIHISEPTRPY